MKENDVFRSTQINSDSYQRVQLGKNIIGTDRSNILYQSDINEESTVYEICSDLDLNGELIVIPQNCILDFKQGSIQNGTIKFQDTIIESYPRKVFVDIKLDPSGTLLNSAVNMAWFCDRINSGDDTDIINDIIFIAAKRATEVFFPKGFYNTRGIVIESYTKIKGESELNQSIISYIGDEDGDVFYAKVLNEDGSANIKNNISIQDVSVFCDKKAKYALNMTGIVESYFSNILLREPRVCGIYAHSSLNGNGFGTRVIYNRFDKVNVYCSPKAPASYGVRLLSETNSNYFYNCRFANVNIGIAIEDDIDVNGEFNPTLGWRSNNNAFVNCSVEPSIEKSVYINSEYNMLSGCRIERGMDGIVFEDSARCQYNTIVGNTYYGLQGSKVIDPQNRNINITLDSQGYLFNKISNDTLNTKKINLSGNINLVKGETAGPQITMTGEESALIIRYFGDNNFHRQLTWSATNNRKNFRFQRGYDGRFTDMQTIVVEGDNPYFSNTSPIKIATVNLISDLPVTMGGDNLSAGHAGVQYFVKEVNKVATWNGSRWVDSNNYSLAINRGTSAQRPQTLKSDDKGFQYFDTAENKPVWWSGTDWVDCSGNPVS